MWLLDVTSWQFMFFKASGVHAILEQEAKSLRPSVDWEYLWRVKRRLVEVDIAKLEVYWRGIVAGRLTSLSV